MNRTSRWVTAVLGLAATCALAATCLAKEGPYPDNSTVTCYGTANAGGTGASAQLPYRCTIGPDGGSPSDDIHVDVVIRNVLGQPEEGVTVVCTGAPQNGAVIVWDGGAPPDGDTDMDPQTKISLADGHADFTYDQGGVRIDAPWATFPTLNFNVTRQGPGPGPPIALAICAPGLSVIAFDMDANCLVDGLDLSRFTATWYSDEQKGDFNFDGVVDGLDLGLLTAHWNKSCDWQ